MHRGDEAHEIQNFTFCDAMLQALIADLGASATYDSLIGRYIETTRLSGFLDAYLVDVVKTGRVVTAIFSGEKREMVNYTILAHDNFNDEWELMTLDSANISICDSRPPLSIEHVQNAIAFVKSEEERKRQLELDRVQKENESFEQFAAHIDEHMPHGTKAVIIAERVGNDSNSLEDYYGSISLDCVIVGWSSHNRNLFPESGKRKAAKRFAPVEHLAELPKDMEHKRSYGYKRAFLKESSNEYADGWMVYKINLFDAGARYIPQSAQICPALLPDADVNTNQPVQVHARSSSGFSVKDLLI